MNCPGCEGCRVYLGHCHLLSVLVRAACQSNGNTHKNYTLTCRVNPGFGRPLVGPVWLGGGTINLQCGWAATLWEGARWRRVWGPDRGSLTLWHHAQGGWACQWVVGFSFSTCIWSRARVFPGFPMAKPWGEPEGPSLGFLTSWGIPWKPGSRLPGVLSTSREPVGIRTHNRNERKKRG